MGSKVYGLAAGSILRDIGKIKYHDVNGCDYLEEQSVSDDPMILNCIRYLDRNCMEKAELNIKDLSYIVFVADNMASASDKIDANSTIALHEPLRPVFNRLNGNNKELFYKPQFLDVNKNFNYPQEEKEYFSEKYTEKMFSDILKSSEKYEPNRGYINSLLGVIEKDLSYVPVTSKADGACDISLFDHARLCAAMSVCIYQWAEEKQITDYKTEIFDKEKALFDEKLFDLISLDISGIQKFIYTISTKNALRMLRARSFYLEIMMEHILDLLIERLDLTRANLLYSGGGHCYLIIPNTEKAHYAFEQYMSEINDWFMEHYDVSLYIAGGKAECSANDLSNEPDGSYQQVFRTIANDISDRKSRRYSAQEIIRLNTRRAHDYRRECNVCKRISDVNNEGVCPVCAEMKKFSADVLYSDYFIVAKGKEGGLILPLGYHLETCSKDDISEKKNNCLGYVRAYCKNMLPTESYTESKLWTGSYTNGATFEEFSKQSTGIERIGVLRADVDYLGSSFIAGFADAENHNRYMTLLRTASMSRQLSLFFKLYLNSILDTPGFSLLGKVPGRRNATIVYSGGDDLFIVGAWNEIIELAVDIQSEFRRFSEESLSISAGIGIYEESYPISVIADEVDKMVDRSKQLNKKNAVTLLEDGCVHNSDGEMISDGTYRWEYFEKEVICEKLKAIIDYAGLEDGAHYKSFIYHLLELIRKQDDRINFARFVYFISRMEPSDDDPGRMAQYKIFADNMYKWVQSEKDRIQLKTAITLYIYLVRETEGD